MYPDGIIGEAEQQTRLEDYSIFFTSLLLLLYEAGVIFIPSQLGGIPFVQSRIPA